MRCNVEVTNENMRLWRFGRGCKVTRHAFQEVQLVGELVVLDRVRLIAACRQVDIVDQRTLDARGLHTGMAFAAEWVRINRFNRVA